MPPAETNKLDAMLEEVKNSLKSIVKQVQRSGSLEWYTILRDKNTQVLYSYAVDDKQAFMPEHIHYDSTEVFIVIRGKFEYNGKVYEAGSTIVVPPATPHCARPLTPDLIMIVVLYPPEVAYQ